MPLASFLIVVGGFLGLIGLGTPFVFGVPAGTADLGSRQFLWVSIVAFPLFLAPGASVIKLGKLTKNMAIFATSCGGLIVLLAIATGIPAIGGYKVGWFIVFLAALGQTAGGALGIKDPPDLA